MVSKKMGVMIRTSNIAQNAKQEHHRGNIEMNVIIGTVTKQDNQKYPKKG